MKTVHLHVRHGGKTTTLVFSRFPIRIGREPPCECRLAFPFVSRSHAVIVLRGGRLLLRDARSKGGTYVHDSAQRLEPGQFVDLATVGFEFQIGRLSLRAELRDDGTQTPRSGMPASREDADDPDGTNQTRQRVSADNATHAYDGEGVSPDALLERAVRTDLAAALARFEAARAELEACVRDTARDADAPGRDQALRTLGLLDGGSEAERRSTEPPPPSHRQEAEVAMRALQEIATFYVPYAPRLVDAATVTALHHRLDRVLRLLFDGFAALRFVYRDDGPSPGPARGIDVGAKLLDWTSGDNALATVEADIIEMIRHHGRFTSSVACGLAKLLSEFDPARIEEAGRKSWFRAVECRRFWEEYRDRHDRIVGDGALAATFGPVVGGAVRSLCVGQRGHGRNANDLADVSRSALLAPT